MKKLVLLSLLVFVNAGAVLADGPRPPKPVKPVICPKHVETSQLRLFQLDPELNLGLVNHGAVTVNYSNREVTLTLTQTPKCEPGAVCPLGFAVKLSQKLELVEVETGACGEKIVTARMDKRPVDGLLKEITVTDNRDNRCRHLVPPVEVRYETESLRGFRTESTMIGDRFEANLYF
ncbi:MAG: hypothetical protein AB7P04_02785 [Bacteriovoracia bacterium]